MRQTGWIVLAAAFLCASCSKAPDFKGEWINADKSTIILSGDSTAVMGQEGMEGAATGSYRSKDDTLWVKSILDTSEGVEFYNRFTFLFRNDSLHLVSVELHRSGDMQSLDGKLLAQRLGKTPEEMAFVRKEKKQ